jgi:hypothetical protein
MLNAGIQVPLAELEDELRMTDHKLNIFANKRKMKIPGTEKKSI